jgi:hypothetical protein
MHNLPAPSLTFAIVYNDCVGRILEPARTALSGEAHAISIAATNYTSLAASAQLFSLPSHVENGDSNSDNHVKLYENHLRRKESDCRKYYNELISPKRTYRCPYCGWAQIKQLDHFLPKRRFFRFSVLPANLVPICSDCNKSKDEHYGVSFESSLFHPYYEPVPAGKWLNVTLSLTGGLSVFYDIVDTTVGHAIGIRLTNQFTTLEIFDGYQDLASNHLVSIRESLEDVLLQGGPEALRTHLGGLRNQALTDSGGDVNNWKVVLYEAAIQNDEIVTLEGLSRLQ